MKSQTLTKNELDLILTIKNSSDPAKALCIAIDILSRFLAGETQKSIMDSYDIEWEDLT